MIGSAGKIAPYDHAREEPILVSRLKTLPLEGHATLRAAFRAL